MSGMTRRGQAITANGRRAGPSGIDAARELAETVGPELAELFVYQGDGHLVTDSSLGSYDADATALVVQRSREFLDRIG